jgi:hypothetical protein
MSRVLRRDSYSFLVPDEKKLIELIELSSGKNNFFLVESINEFDPYKYRIKLAACTEKNMTDYIKNTYGECKTKKLNGVAKESDNFFFTIWYCKDTPICLEFEIKNK